MCTAPAVLYETIEGICQKVNVVSRTITIDGKVLAIDDIAGITGELFDHMDEEVS